MTKDHSSNQVSPEELDRLIGLLFDKCLAPEEVQRLHAALENSEDHRELYLDLIETHASLAWQRRWQPPIKAVLEASELHEFELAQTASVASHLSLAKSSPSMSLFSMPLVVMSAVAASVLITLLLTGRFGGEKRLADRPNVVVQQPNQSIDTPPSSGNQTAATKPADQNSQSEMNLGGRPVLVAQIGESVKAVWGGSLAPDHSDVVGKGWLQLESGMARLDFFSGVRMVVHGPAKLNLRSSWDVFLESGSIRCEVGETGKGFRVQAKGMDIVDLGTEFGMRVGPAGDPEVHVFSGKVALMDEAGNQKLEIVEREAMQVSGGELKRAQYSESGFNSVGEITRQANIAKDSKFLAWRQAADRISSDPATVVHYTMKDQQRDDLKIINQAIDADEATDAMVIGCRLTEGRWPNKQAVQFEGNGDRLLLAVNQPQDSMTAIMWVRIDQNDQEIMGLIMGEEPSRQSAANVGFVGGLSQADLDKFNASKIKLTRWGVWSSGALRLAHFRRTLDAMHLPWDDYDSEPNPVLQPSRQWNQIAVTYDSENREVRQFVNGAQIQLWKTPSSDSLRLGHLAIGNLSLDEREIARGVTRDFFGAIDEVVISSRAYSPEEILANYQTGKP